MTDKGLGELMPVISVIVPIYRVEKYIYCCIDSILAQTLACFELILVDDGSPDGSGEICDEYAEKDSRVSVIHKKNGGLSDARNAGIELIIKDQECEWITFIDSDDWIDSHYLEALYHSVRTEGAEVSCSKYLECKDSGETDSGEVFAPEVSCYGGEDFSVEEYKYSQTAWGKLFKREHWESLRFPVGRIHEDAFTIYQILLPSQRVAFVSEPPLYFFNSGNDESITRKKWSPRRMDLIEAIEKKLEYAKRNGYSRYYRIQIREYVNTLGYNFCQATENKSENNARIIRDKMKKALADRDYREVFPFKNENFWIYEIAHPFQMKIYWYVQSIKSKLKRGNR